MITDAGRVCGAVGRSISCTGQRTVPQPTTITTSHKTAAVWAERPPLEMFGASVAAGDIDNDGFDDVIIGVPVITDAGVGSVVLSGRSISYGTGNAFSSTIIISQNSSGVDGVSGVGDEFERSSRPATLTTTDSVT